MWIKIISYWLQNWMCSSIISHTDFRVQSVEQDYLILISELKAWYKIISHWLQSWKCNKRLPHNDFRLSSKFRVCYKIISHWFQGWKCVTRFLILISQLKVWYKIISHCRTAELSCRTESVEQDYLTADFKVESVIHDSLTLASELKM